MKKVYFSAFVAFWSIIATVVAIQVLADQNMKHTKAGLQSYTLTQVAEHATKFSCWMAIEGKVYDFTEYLDKHPGGAGTMIPWCGREATKGMRTKGYGADHSVSAWRQMNKYLIGNLKSAT